VIEGPAWSPDGSRIAFSIKQGAPDCQLSDYNIYTVDPDGGNRKKLTEGCGGMNTGAEWSPDGSQIVFVSRRSSPQDIKPSERDIEIWVMDADGSNQTRLTYHGENDTGPKWAPRGDKIYFARWRQLGAGGTSSLWQMNPDGTSQELVREFVGLLTGIEVSPDGLSLMLEIMDLTDYATDLFHLEINTGAIHQIDAWDGSDHLGSWRKH
jgi:TolB protein